MGKPAKAVRLPDLGKVQGEIAKLIKLGSRDPFKDVLSLFLTTPPTKSAIKRQAQANPQLWANSISTLSACAGFSSLNTNLDLSLSASIGELSDSDLNKRIVELQQGLNVSLNPAPASTVLETATPPPPQPLENKDEYSQPRPPTHTPPPPLSLSSPTDQTEAPPTQTREVGGRPPLQQRQEEA